MPCLLWVPPAAPSRLFLGADHHPGCPGPAFRFIVGSALSLSWRYCPALQSKSKRVMRQWPLVMLHPGPCLPTSHRICPACEVMGQVEICTLQENLQCLVG